MAPVVILGDLWWIWVINVNLGWFIVIYCGFVLVDVDFWCNQQAKKLTIHRFIFGAWHKNVLIFCGFACLVGRFFMDLWEFWWISHRGGKNRKWGGTRRCHRSWFVDDPCSKPLYISRQCGQPNALNLPNQEMKKTMIYIVQKRPIEMS